MGNSMINMPNIAENKVVILKPRPNRRQVGNVRERPSGLASADEYKSCMKKIWRTQPINRDLPIICRFGLLRRAFAT